jgi:hypothetical protein
VATKLTHRIRAYLPFDCDVISTHAAWRGSHHCQVVVAMIVASLSWLPPSWLSSCLPITMVIVVVWCEHNWTILEALLRKCITSKELKVRS